MAEDDGKGAQVGSDAADAPSGAPAAARAPQAEAATSAQQQRRKKRGGLDATSRALLGASLGVALLAAFWPQLSPVLLELLGQGGAAGLHPPAGDVGGGSGGSGAQAKGARAGSACPLGYTSSSALPPGTSLPAGHPPVGPGPEAAAAAAASGTLWFRARAIWTGDLDVPEANVCAVDLSKGEIVKCGDEEDIGIPAGDPVVDLGPTFVMPGIVDSHTHFIPGGLGLASVDLRRAKSRAEFEAAVAAAAAKLGPDEWLTGGFWDDNQWGGALPDASWLDGATGGRPALLLRMDSHLALANSAALALAGVGPGTADPPEGSVDRDADGKPTGILRETAMRLVSSVIPTPSPERRQAAALAAAAYALSRGVTSVVDFGRSPLADHGASLADLQEVYDPLAAAGKLPLRVYAFIPLDQWGAAAARAAASGHAHPGGRLFTGGVKAFADGSLGSRTALMHEPYADQPGHYGMRMADPARLRADAEAADASGLQIAVHAIGDRAVDDVLDIFKAVTSKRAAAAGSSKAGRAALRVEHAQHISGPETAARFGALARSVAAVANPQHFVTDAPMLEPRLGRERASPGRAFAWTALKAAGAAPVAAGSDWPVVDMLPFQGVAAAAARARAAAAAAGSELSPAAAVEGALRMHTAASAAAAGPMGARVGRLAPGLKADFVVLEASPLEAAAEAGTEAAAEGARVLRTYVDGRCAHGCGGA